MSAINLKNKPLVEAIFELRWSLAGAKGRIDPNIKILPGVFFSNIKTSYEFYEALPTSNFPEEFSAQIVQHRFRVKKDSWPLVQLGPGILTLNDIHDYSWDDFSKRVKNVLNAFKQSHPKSAELVVDSLVLRYIDAIPFDFSKEDVFLFLRDEMKVNIAINPEIFAKGNIKSFPQNFNASFSLPTQKPLGTTTLAFASGKSKGADSLIWETIVKSNPISAVYDVKNIVSWIDDAHEITHDCFFKTIDGNLRKRFE